jgi:hypothetical protein
MPLVFAHVPGSPNAHHATSGALCAAGVRKSPNDGPNGDERRVVRRWGEEVAGATRGEAFFDLVEERAAGQPVVSSERIAWISSIDASSASSTLGSKCLPRSRVIQEIVDSSDHAWR